jgi:hypothetical protein
MQMLCYHRLRVRLVRTWEGVHNSASHSINFCAMIQKAVLTSKTPSFMEIITITALRNLEKLMAYFSSVEIMFC